MLDDVTWIVIVGGGMAGLCAAISAAETWCEHDGNGKAVVVLMDAGKETGRKILATGNGRCNLTNRRQDAAFYRAGEQGADFPFHPDGWELEMKDFMESLGILLHERDGYVYPRCDQAAAVREALLRRAEKGNVTIVTECRVREIRREASGGYWVSWTYGSDTHYCTEDLRSIPADAVILSTGGMVSGAYHCMGDGYRLARELGHHVTEPVPALCALFTDDPNRKIAAGVRTACAVRLLIDGRKAAEDCGEIQMTADGISGIPVFQISRFAARSLKDTPKKEITAVLDFLPELSEEEWKREKKRRLLQMSEQDTLGDFCLGLVPDKIASYLIADLSEVRERKISNLKDRSIPEKLLDRMRNKTVRITGTADFEKAQVTAGGIPLSEITEEMESRFAKGLYLAGELLDVDGCCGGYNLTWAMHSGRLAGRNAVRNRNRN